MEIYILENDNTNPKTRFQPKAIVSEYYSLIWTERFSTDGQFEIKAPVTPRNLENFKQENWISHSETMEVMIVKTREIVLDESSGEYILDVKGFQATHFFKWRTSSIKRLQTTTVGGSVTDERTIIPGDPGYYWYFRDPEANGEWTIHENPTSITYTNTTPSKVIKTLMTRLTSPGLSIPEDSLSGIFRNIEHMYGTEASLTYSMPQKDAYSILYDMVNTGGIGIRVVRPSKDAFLFFYSLLWGQIKNRAESLDVVVSDLPNDLSEVYVPNHPSWSYGINWDYIFPDVEDPENSEDPGVVGVKVLILFSNVFGLLSGAKSHYILFTTDGEDRSNQVIFDLTNNDLNKPKYFWAETQATRALSVSKYSGVVVDKSVKDEPWNERKTIYSINSDSSYASTPTVRTPTWWEFVKNQEIIRPPVWRITRTIPRGPWNSNPLWQGARDIGWMDLNYSEPNLYDLGPTELNDIYNDVLSGGTFLGINSYLLLNYGPWHPNHAIRTKISMVLFWKRQYGDKLPTPGPNNGPLDINYEPDVAGTNALVASGEKAISETISGIMVTGEVPTTTRFKYNKDYRIGDVVRVVGGYGVDVRLRVEEYILTVDSEGVKGYPTLSEIKDLQ